MTQSSSWARTTGASAARPARPLEQRTFDLTSLQGVDRAWKRPRLVYVSMILGTFAVLLGDLAWSSFRSLGSPGPLSGPEWSSVILASLVATALGAGVLSLPRLFRGASEVVVGRRGIEFAFPDGQKQFLSWESTGGFDLVDCRNAPKSPIEGAGLLVSGTRPWARRTLLTPEATACVIDAARAHGLGPRTQAPSVPYRETGAIRYRFRALIRPRPRRRSEKRSPHDGGPAWER